MSGGSYDYAYLKLEELADNIQPTTALRRAFKRRLRLFAKAAQDIEWVDSCDMSPGDEDSAIREALGTGADAFVLAEAVDRAVQAKDELEKAMKEARQ